MPFICIYCYLLCHLIFLSTNRVFMAWFSKTVLSRDNNRVLMNTIATSSITTLLILILWQFAGFYDTHMSLYSWKKKCIETLQSSLYYSLMTNTSCELSHVILISTRLPIFLSEYQILSEYSPQYLFQSCVIPQCFSVMGHIFVCKA